MSIKYNVGEIGNRPWGTWHCIAVGDKYIVKIITVKPYASLSLQLHKMRSDHWVVVSGAPRITVGDSVSDFHCGESVDIPVDTRHRLENLTDAPVVVLEVQMGDVLDETDIVRLSDIYNRQ